MGVDVPDSFVAQTKVKTSHLKKIIFENVYFFHQKRRLQNILHRLWESKEKIRPEVVEVRFLSFPSPMVIRIEEVFQVRVLAKKTFFMILQNFQKKK